MIQPVGIGELQIGRSPLILVAYGIGSCLGVTLYDLGRNLGGMVHSLLPERSPDEPVPDPKYVTDGVETLLNRLLSQGANRATLRAKLAGGAHICPGLIEAPKMAAIGQRNLLAARNVLERLKIPLVAEDSAGDFGRNLFFDLETGTLTIQRVDCREHRTDL